MNTDIMRLRSEYSPSEHYDDPICSHGCLYRLQSESTVQGNHFEINNSAEPVWTNGFLPNYRMCKFVCHLQFPFSLDNRH